MDKKEWIETYKPKVDAEGNLITYDVVDDLDFIQSQDEKYVWSEIWDFDTDSPLLTSGLILDEDGASIWYLCEVPVPEGLPVVLEWEDE